MKFRIDLTKRRKSDSILCMIHLSGREGITWKKIVDTLGAKTPPKRALVSAHLSLLLKKGVILRVERGLYVDVNSPYKESLVG